MLDIRALRVNLVCGLQCINGVVFDDKQRAINLNHRPHGSLFRGADIGHSAAVPLAVNGSFRHSAFSRAWALKARRVVRRRNTRRRESRKRQRLLSIHASKGALPPCKSNSGEAGPPVAAWLFRFISHGQKSRPQVPLALLSGLA